MIAKFTLTLVLRDLWTSMRSRRHLSELFERAQGITLVAPLRQSSITFHLPVMVLALLEIVAPNIYSVSIVAKVKVRVRKEVLNLVIIIVL